MFSAFLEVCQNLSSYSSDIRQKSNYRGGNSDEVTAMIQLPPASQSALVRLAKVKQVNEAEIKRKRSTAYIWDDKKRLFCPNSICV